MRRRGLGYLGYLIWGYLVPKTAIGLVQRYSPRRLRMAAMAFSGFIILVVLVSLLLAGTTVWVVALAVGLSLPAACMAWLIAQELRLRRMLRQARRLTSTGQGAMSPGQFTHWEDWPAPEPTRLAVEALRQQDPHGEILLGRFDNDGRVMVKHGPLPYLEAVQPEDFSPRYQNPLDIILREGLVLVRKDFRKNRRRFIQEWYNLACLQGSASVPAVFSADEKTHCLIKNLVPGPTLRKILSDGGAKILTSQTQSDPALAALKPQDRLQEVWQRGRKILPQLISESFLDFLEEQVNAIHRLGFAGLSLTFGNVIREEATGQPWLIDLEGAQEYASRFRPAFLLRRDQDRRKFNQIYGKEILTETAAHNVLAAHAKKMGGWYAPIDFGGGLATPGFWSVDSGTGRWEYLNSRVVDPLVNGKTVLDLGANNGVMGLMMLRAGAARVIGLELDAANIETACLVQRLFEWREMRRYDLEMRQADMLDILSGGWPEFQVVTAFCSLYYLCEEDMQRVVRRAAELAPTIILQAKTDTREQAQAKRQRSSLDFLKMLLEENGFPRVEVTAPDGYPRPLLVGKRDGG